MIELKNKHKNIIILLIIISFFSASTTTTATNCIDTYSYEFTQTLYVGGNGSNNYTKIQDAIDNASVGDTVFVYSGLYPEHILINKEINLIGETKEQTIIIGSYSNNMIKIMANNVKIMSFTIKNGQIGIYTVDSSNFKIIQNLIIDNWEGIGILNSSFGLISSNILQNNDFEGINPVSSSNIVISSNLIENSIEGIFLSSSTSNIIYGNTIRDHIYGLEAGQSSDNNKIFHNNFYDNDQNAKDACTNIWDDSYPSGGNYFDDYTGSDNNGDGIGDTPYNVPGGSNKDRYPLMNKWNEPPYQPSDPNPRNDAIGVPTNPILSVYISDPEGNKMDVSFYDASTQDLIGVANNIPSFTRAQITWNNLLINNTYFWYAIADDGTYKNQSDTWKFTVGEATNYPPEAPIIDGPKNGKIDIDYEYKFSANDQNQDQIYYYINWGDGNNTGWLGPYLSGEEISVIHKWSNKGTYIIRAKAKDINNAESQESTFEINIPRARVTDITFLKTFNIHPYLFKLLRLISLAI